MKKPIFSREQVLLFGNDTEPDAQIIYHTATYIQYEQIRLNDIYKQYLETALLSKKVFRTAQQKSLLKNSYQLASGSKFCTISFDTTNRQFHRLEISLTKATNTLRYLIFILLNWHQ